MERRKFMIGIGSLAAGGAAATGTGAFSTVETERDANIAVRNDNSSNANLQLSASGLDYWSDRGESNGKSPYAQNSGPQLVLNFDGEDNSDNNNLSSSSALNNDATTTIPAVFQMQNNGPNEVQVGIDVSELEDIDYIESVEAHAHGSGASLDDSLDFSTDPVSIDNGRPNAQLDSGESLAVDFTIETSDSTLNGPDETATVNIGAVATDPSGN